ncbi:MAG: 4Fe-4S dicluster domain-containing protein [Gammaproteobacteria bacterium]|nr:4Fe-4S dicluster domain-containing protein [Gammaproteobacteria bacterium]
MSHFLAYEQIGTLLDALRNLGYICMGPQVQDGTIVFDELSNASQLPWGMRDTQKPGYYRLQKDENKEAFAWANGPQAIKPLLFKPKESLWQVQKNKQGKLIFAEISPEQKPIALIGARSCDLAAMAIQDKTLIQGKFVDTHYQWHREHLLVIAVNCSYSGGNCFCVSTQTGPKATSGYDLALTEIDKGFVVDIGSDKGHALINAVQCTPATEKAIEKAASRTTHAAHMQSKRMPKNNSRALRDILMNNLHHPRWQAVAERCLSCGNCTAVCPTCFCHHQTETPSAQGDGSVHAREWDSCFTQGHSYIHGQVVRDTTDKRYKQWLTHKLGTWWDQFDTSGCVGCGRCVTWCPVGIDLTEEMAAIAGESNVVSDRKKGQNDN